jgi:hypothetical protein
MATNVQEYDINSLLKGLTPSESSVGSAKEYDINSLLTELKPYKAESITAGAGATPSNIMKGMEFFAKGGPLMAAAKDKAIASDAAQKFIKPLQEMSIEDWKQHSLLAPMIEYSVGTMYPQSGFDTEAAKQKLIEKGKAFYQGGKEFISNPIETLGTAAKAIIENPYGVAGQGVKSTIYDPEQIPAGIVGTQVAKNVIGKTVAPVAENLGKQFQAAKANLGVVEKPIVPEQTPGGVPGAAPIPKATVEVSQPTTPVVEPTPAPLNPFLQEQVKRAKQAGQEVDPGALNRQNEAMSIDPRLTLTEGQALQDPNLISVERNERGIKEKLVEKFNEQNQILKEKAESYKNQFTPDVKGLSYVENSTHAINAVDDLIGKNEAAAKAKYEDLKKLGGGKLELDGKTFGTTAREALGVEDIQDFVPSQIMKRIDAYADGTKQMNLNLFESLRTQIARESRKAERAGDGNTVHALSVVRNQLEQMPLANEVGAIKAVADEARGLFKANRDLEANNPFYGQASRGGLDSKDFVPKVAFRSKNDYFASAMEVLDKDPMAKQNFAQGTMDYMIRESTDGSGNLNPMKMANYIDDLQLNNRLEPLFGKENASELLKFARVSRYTKSTPEGSFVNYSNTAPAGANLIQKYGPAAAEVVGANMGIPFVGAAARKGSEFMQQRKYSKQAAEATKPGAGVVKGKGTKLEDMLKD